jgi:hypothetical protein
MVLGIKLSQLRFLDFVGTKISATASETRSCGEQHSIQGRMEPGELMRAPGQRDSRQQQNGRPKPPARSSVFSSFQKLRFCALWGPFDPAYTWSLYLKDISLSTNLFGSSTQS